MASGAKTKGRAEAKAPAMAKDANQRTGQRTPRVPRIGDPTSLGDAATLIEALPHGLVLLEADGRARYANRAARRALGGSVRSIAETLGDGPLPTEIEADGTAYALRWHPHDGGGRLGLLHERGSDAGVDGGGDLRHRVRPILTPEREDRQQHGGGHGRGEEKEEKRGRTGSSVPTPPRGGTARSARPIRGR